MAFRLEKPPPLIEISSYTLPTLIRFFVDQGIGVPVYEKVHNLSIIDRDSNGTWVEKEFGYNHVHGVILPRDRDSFYLVVNDGSVLTFQVNNDVVCPEFDMTSGAVPFSQMPEYDGKLVSCADVFASSFVREITIVSREINAQTARSILRTAVDSLPRRPIESRLKHGISTALTDHSRRKW